MLTDPRGSLDRNTSRLTHHTPVFTISVRGFICVYTNYSRRRNLHPPLNEDRPRRTGILSGKTHEADLPYIPYTWRVTLLPERNVHGQTKTRPISLWTRYPPKTQYIQDCSTNCDKCDVTYSRCINVLMSSNTDCGQTRHLFLPVCR